MGKFNRVAWQISKKIHRYGFSEEIRRAGGRPELNKVQKYESSIFRGYKFGLSKYLSLIIAEAFKYGHTQD